MVALAKPDNLIDFPQPQQKSNEWYTPARYVEAAREVMGGIDLDPASCFEANQTVKATRYFTECENGLTQEWHGRVWLNPPYSNDKSLPDEKRSNIARWIYRLVRDYQVGNITQAILLSTCTVNAKWFQPLWCYPICFVNHFVRFTRLTNSPSRPGRTTDSHFHGSIFVYLGPNEQKFIDIFSRFGRIARAIDVPRQTVVPLNLWEVGRC